MTKKPPLTVDVRSGWGTFSFELPSDTIEEFIQVVAALSRWRKMDIDALVVTERDLTTGRFKSRA